MKRNPNKMFPEVIYSTSPRKNYPTKEILKLHLDEIWSTDLAGFLEYRVSNIKTFRYIFNIIEIFSIKMWAKLFQKKFLKQKEKNFRKF